MCEKRGVEADWGSSPQVRGKDGSSARPRRGLRIIPARGCGEKTLRTACPRASVGSSPRVRGKADDGAEVDAEDGIIPAGAGKRSSGGFRVWLAGDHPRGCGEKYNVDNAFVDAQGSSPRVRGKGNICTISCICAGIIPAGAGKRSFLTMSAFMTWDHPRGCGEKWRK